MPPYAWCLLFGANCLARQEQDAGSAAGLLELQGQFKQAASLLTTALLNNSLPVTERKRLEFELDRLERIRKDFPNTKEDLFAEAKGSVKNLTAEEYDRWLAEGRFDSREIDGRRCFVNTCVSDLFFRYPEWDARRLPPKDTTALQKARLESCTAIGKAALAGKNPLCAAQTISRHHDRHSEGDRGAGWGIIRAWLPIPRHYPFQDDFELTSASPPVNRTDSKDSPIRCVYMEQPARKNAPTPFKIEYEYTTHAVSFDIKPEDVRPCDPNDPAVKGFTGEAPHVVFTPEMRALSKKIVGDETNPCLKAKKCFDWIAENINTASRLSIRPSGTSAIIAG